MSKFILSAFCMLGLGTFAQAQSVDQVVIATCDGGIGDVWIKYDLAKQSMGSGNTIWVTQFTVSGKTVNYSEKNAQLTHDKETYDFTLTVDGVAHTCKATAVSG